MMKLGFGGDMMVAVIINESLQLFVEEGTKELLVPQSIKGSRVYVFEETDDYLVEELKEIFERFVDQPLTFVFWGDPQLPSYIMQCCTALELAAQGILPLSMIAPVTGCQEIALDRHHRLVVRRNGAEEILGTIAEFWARRFMQSRTQALQAQQEMNAQIQSYKKLLDKERAQLATLSSRCAVQERQRKSLQKSGDSLKEECRQSQAKLQKFRERFYTVCQDGHDHHILGHVSSLLSKVRVLAIQKQDQTVQYPIYEGETIIGTSIESDIIVQDFKGYIRIVKVGNDITLYNHTAITRLQRSKFKPHKMHKQYELESLNHTAIAISKWENTKIILGKHTLLFYDKEYYFAK